MRKLAWTLAVGLALPPLPSPAAPPSPEAPPPAPSSVEARSPEARPDAPPTIPVTAAEVAVDFVVRDKKGRIVRDLRPAEMEVYEDGVRQEVVLFQILTTATPAGAPGPEAAGPSPSPSGPSPGTPPAATAASAPSPEIDREAFLALVFDRLSPVARRNAYDAALTWVKRPAVQGRQVGVFRIDQGLEQLQPFTDDRGPVMQALDDVLNTVPTSFSSSQDRERIRTLRQQIAIVEGRVIAPGGPGSAADSDAPMVTPDSWRRSGPAKEVFRRQVAAELSMLQALESLERDQQGLATTNGLLALANGLKTLPGRKAVVFFSEGLVLPDRVVGTLASVISEANRGAVSFYAVDAAGLRVKSAADETRRELSATADAIQAATHSDATLAARSGMTRLLERNEDVLRFDPASGLGALARDTGGFLVRDTNDIAAALGRVEEELGAYYLLSYAPKNEAWDGGYRRIDVRARRSGLSVQARRGYYAVRTPTPTPVLEHEAPALARLESAPGARDLPVRARAAHFPAEDGDSVLAIAAELPGGAPALRPDKDPGVVAQDFTVLALVRDASGRVVHKTSRHYALSWPKARTDEVRRGRIYFDREAVLPPGRYTVEVVAWDAHAGVSGVDRLALTAPAPARGAVRLSSLVVVGHSEPRALGEPGPLQVQGVHLFPSFGEVVRVGAGKPVAFVFTLRPGERPIREASVELDRNGETARRARVPLPPPDAAGDVRVVSGLPVADLAPGAYTLRLVVDDGRGFETRTAAVTLGP
jgi:VWFA-related protein